MAVQVTSMIDVDYISYNSLVRIIHKQTQAYLKSEEP
jgi:hypothetical protein